MPTSKRVAIILLSLFIALPITFACIWAVGVSNALFSSDSQLIPNLSKTIIKDAPSLVNGFVEIYSIPQINEGGHKTNKNSITLIQAVRKSSITPGEMIENIGIYAWMQSDLSNTFEKTDRILKGKDSPVAVSVNIKKLKEAIKSDVFVDYLKEVYKNMPACSDQEMISWQYFAMGSTSKAPVCYPGDQFLNGVMKLSVEQVDSIPDEAILIQEDKVSHISPNLCLLLLLIPTLVIAVISLIGKTDGVSFLKTYGIIVLAVGAVNILFANIVKYTALKVWSTATLNINAASGTQVDMDKVAALTESMQNITSVIAKDLITPVIGTAVGVTILGAILLGISLTISSNKIQKTIPEKPKSIKKAKLKK